MITILIDSVLNTIETYGAFIGSLIAVAVAGFTLKTHTKNVTRQLNHQKILTHEKLIKEKKEEFAMTLLKLGVMLNNSNTNLINIHESDDSGKAALLVDTFYEQDANMSFEVERLLTLMSLYQIITTNAEQSYIDMLKELQQELVKLLDSHQYIEDIDNKFCASYQNICKRYKKLSSEFLNEFHKNF